MFSSYFLVNAPNFIAAECLEQPITAEQQDLILLPLMCCDIGDCADHARESSVFPQLGLWVSNGAGNV